MQRQRARLWGWSLARSLVKIGRHRSAVALVNLNRTALLQLPRGQEQSLKMVSMGRAQRRA